MPSRADLGSFGSKDNEEYKLQHSQKGYSSSIFLYFPFTCSKQGSALLLVLFVVTWGERVHWIRKTCEEKVHCYRDVEEVPNPETKYFRLCRIIKMHLKCILKGLLDIFFFNKKPCRAPTLPAYTHI